MVTEIFPGVAARYSGYLEVPSTSAVDPAGTTHRWHLLDNHGELEERGISPVGTLLCVHGNPTWSYLWRELLNHVSAHALPWRVVAVDQLDMGFSPRTGPASVGRPGQRPRGSDRCPGLGRPGHHGGTRLGRHHFPGLGLGTPAAAGRVVLTNTAVHPAGFQMPAALRLASHPAVHGWGTKSTDAFLRVTHSLAHPKLDPGTREAFMAPYTSAERRDGVANFVADIPFAPDHPSRSTLESIAESLRTLFVPALLLWGPKDPVFSDRYLRDLMSRLPHAQVHRFESAGHLLPEDRDIATPIFDWLDKQNRQDGPAGRAEPLNGYRPMLAELDARTHDNTAAVVDVSPPRTLSWSDLGHRVNTLAAGLASIGVRSGSRVNLLVPPGIELTP